jgi:hypothetical protein
MRSVVDHNHFLGAHFVWEKGRWEVPPRPHAKWIAPRWQHRHNEYVFVEGRWR